MSGEQKQMLTVDEIIAFVADARTGARTVATEIGAYGPLSNTDPSKMRIDWCNGSCGIGVLTGLYYPPKAIVKRALEMRIISEDLRTVKDAFIIFSDTTFSSTIQQFSGHTLAKYIRDNNLGQLWESPVRRNPNSGNPIVLWVWMPVDKDPTKPILPAVTREEFDQRFEESRQQENKNDGTK